MLNPIYWTLRLGAYWQAHRQHNPAEPASYKPAPQWTKPKPKKYTCVITETPGEQKVLTAIQWTLIVAGVLVVCVVVAVAYNTYQVYQDYGRQGYSLR